MACAKKILEKLNTLRAVLLLQSIALRDFLIQIDTICYRRYDIWMPPYLHKCFQTRM